MRWLRAILWTLVGPHEGQGREYWNHRRSGPSEADHLKDAERRVDDEDSEGQQMIDREIANY
jgi:hypothetical protein